MKSIILKNQDKSPLAFSRGLVISACFMCFVLSCKEEPKEVLQTFENGNVSRRHFEIDGKKEGVMTSYYADGSVEVERLFENDLQHGRTLWYYPDGTRKESQLFEKGVQIGDDSLWMPSGALQRVISFENGKKHGPMRTWSETGELILEVIFDNDSLIAVNKTLMQPDSASVPQ